MSKRILRRVSGFLFIASLLSCNASNNSITSPGELSTGAVIDPIQTTSTWNTPSTITEIPLGDNSGAPMNFTTNGDGGFFAAWDIKASNGIGSQAQFGVRPAFDTPWQVNSPDLSGFNMTLRPQLYAHPDNAVVYATWYNPDYSLNNTYMSRYHPANGWSQPLAFSRGAVSNMIVGPKGDALLLWSTHAENGTVELHARYAASDGTLSLKNTLILGTPDRPKQFDSVTFDGWISETGVAQIYWVTTGRDQQASSSVTHHQLWHGTYAITQPGWSEPEMIFNEQIIKQGGIQQLDVSSDQQGNVVVILKLSSFNIEEGLLIYALESNAGIWSQIKAIDIPPVIGQVSGSAVASNSNGQVVVAWSEIDRNSGNSDPMRTFATVYTPETGWAAPSQLSQPNAPDVQDPTDGSNFGGEPQISINQQGQAVVIWVNFFDAASHFYTNHYDPTNGWGNEEIAVVSTQPFNQVNRFNIAINKDGNSSIIWQEAARNADNQMTLSIRTTEHIGAANATANLNNSPNVIKNLPNQAAGGVPSTPIRFPVRRIETSLSAQQQAARAILASQPIKLSSAWDEPILIDELILNGNVNANLGYPLYLISNDSGNAIVNFSSLPDSTAAEGSGYVSNLWTGTIPNGAWEISSILNRDGANPFYVSDMKVEPTSGDIYVALASFCGQSCIDLYSARRLSDGTWETPVLIANNQQAEAEILINESANISALWIASSNVTDNITEFSYAEWLASNGWSTPELFTYTGTMATAATDITIQSHGRSSTRSKAIVTADGVISFVPNSFYKSPAQNPTEQHLIQRHPVNGWKISTILPVISQGWPGYAVSLNASNTDNALNMILFHGNSSEETQLLFTQYLNGNWSDITSISTPKLGDMMTGQVISANNKNGVILVAWNEQVTEPNFIVTRQIRVNRYDPSTGWSVPTVIGFPIPSLFVDIPGMPTYYIVSHMRVSINEAGQGVVAWIDNSDIQKKLNIVHLDASMANSVHEIVATVDGTQTYFNDLDVHIDSQGQVTLAWNEVTPSDTNQTHRLFTTTHHEAGNIISPPVTPAPLLPPNNRPEPPSASANWSEPATVWFNSSGPEANNYTYPPQISTLGSNVMVSLRDDRQFDKTTDTFVSTTHTIVSSNSQGSWQTENPFANLPPAVMSNAQTAIHSMTGVPLVAWLSQQQLFINRQTNPNIWGEPLSVATDASQFYLLTNKQGQIAMVWQTSSDPSTVLVSEISVDATSTLQVAQASPSTLENSRLQGLPVINDTGTITLLRQVDVSAEPPMQDYQLSQYTMGNGWQVAPAINLNASGFNTNTLKLASTSDGQLMVFAQSTETRRLFSALFNADNTWSNWSDITANRTAPSALAGQYRVASDSNSQLYVMWPEERMDESGQPIYQVLFSRAELANPSTAALWTTPEPITEIAQPNFHETPQLLVASDGSAAAVWSQPVDIFANGILVKKYRPATGWETDKETAVISFSEDFSSALSNNGTLFVFWSELAPDGSAVRVSRSQF